MNCDYKTFKQYMKLLAVEYKNQSFPTNYSSSDFVQWLTFISEPEKRQEEKWKPARHRNYFVPLFGHKRQKYTSLLWSGDSVDKSYYEQGLVCKTPEEAIALAERMLEAIKN